MLLSSTKLERKTKKERFVKTLVWLIILLYFVIPFDLLPDMIHPLGGRIDDLFIGYLGYSWLKRWANRHHFNKKSMPHKDNDNASKIFNPYEILGIVKGDSKINIKKAYHEKLAEYHPDKVSHLGIELQNVAKEKTLLIQRAYDALK